MVMELRLLCSTYIKQVRVSYLLKLIQKLQYGLTSVYVGPDYYVPVHIILTRKGWPIVDRIHLVVISGSEIFYHFNFAKKFF